MPVKMYPAVGNTNPTPTGVKRPGPPGKRGTVGRFTSTINAARKNGVGDTAKGIGKGLIKRFTGGA